jgi:hypothetical protein
MRVRLALSENDGDKIFPQGNSLSAGEVFGADFATSLQMRTPNDAD